MQAKDPQYQTPFIDVDEWRDAQRRGATGEPHGRILNLARVRVVVS